MILIVFLFAPTFHTAMKHIAPIRKALKVRTIFNFLGPLANPASAQHQIIGVSDRLKADSLGQALMELGSQHVLVVYSDDGMDEASIGSATTVLDFTSAGMKRFRIEPREGLSIDDIRGGSPEENAAIIKQIAAGEGTAAQIEIVAMNAGLALYAADAVDSYEAGKAKAETVLRSTKLSTYLNTL